MEIIRRNPEACIRDESVRKASCHAANIMLTRYNSFAAIVPHDTNALAGGKTAGIYVGVAGDVTVLNDDGTAVKFKAAPVGVLPVAAKVVKSTGTTATDLVALYAK